MAGTEEGSQGEFKLIGVIVLMLGHENIRKNEY